MPEPTRALSQWEVDSLLNQIPDSGEPLDGNDVGLSGGSTLRDHSASRVIKTYDFRRPDKFSKEQWQTLTAMHEAFARMVGGQFSSRLRTLVTVRLSSIDQGLYEEWQLQVPSATACYVFTLPPLAGSIVVEFNHDVASEVVDRLLGGNALLPVRDREFSDIELQLLRTYGRAIETALAEMWMNVQAIQPEVQDLGLDASVIQIAGANDVVVTAFFEVNLGNRLGAMSMCMPYAVLEPIASKLSAQVWLTQGQAAVSDARTRRAVRTVLGTAPLELSVELGAVDLPARDVAELQVGDTFVLDARIDRALPISVGGQRRFTGRPGMVGNHLALRVGEVLMPLSASEEPEAEPTPVLAQPPALTLLSAAAPAASAQIDDYDVEEEEATDAA